MHLLLNLVLFLMVNLLFLQILMALLLVVVIDSCRLPGEFHHIERDGREPGSVAFNWNERGWPCVSKRWFGLFALREMHSPLHRGMAVPKTEQHQLHDTIHARSFLLDRRSIQHRYHHDQYHQLFHRIHAICKQRVNHALNVRRHCSSDYHEVRTHE